MAKDKQQQQSKPKRGEAGMMRTLLRKARNVAKSSGKPALERYLGIHSNLKSHFRQDINSLVASTWTPKPRVKQQPTAAPTTT